MTPYIKKIVELHKIHKAIEGENGGNGGGSSNNIPFPFNGEEMIPVAFIHFDDFRRDSNGNYLDVNNVTVYNLNELNLDLFDEYDEHGHGTMFMYLYDEAQTDMTKHFTCSVYGYKRTSSDYEWSGPSYQHGPITSTIKVNGTTYYAAPIGG